MNYNLGNKNYEDFFVTKAKMLYHVSKMTLSHYLFGFFESKDLDRRMRACV